MRTWLINIPGIPLLAITAPCSAPLRDVVVATLEHARRKYRSRIYGFVVMPEHVHLLLSERATLAQRIQSLKIASNKRSSSSRLPGAPLWQPRGYDRNIRDYREFQEKLNYIHQNPIKRGLCAQPQDWQWSSARSRSAGPPEKTAASRSNPNGPPESESV